MSTDGQQNLPQNPQLNVGALGWRVFVLGGFGLFAAGIFGALTVLYFTPKPAPPTPPPLPVPYAAIEGPTKVQAGKLVEYTADGSRGDVKLWSVPDPVVPGRRTFSDTPPDWRKLENGDRLIGTFPQGGRENIDLLVIDSATKTHAVASIAVEIQGPAPPPVPPGPDPPTPPVPPVPPPVPDGRFGLAKLVIGFAATVAQPAAEKRALAQALAANFDGMAAATAAGTVKNLDELQQKTEAANIASQGVARSYWLPFWSQLAGALNAMDGTTLKTLADFCEAWREIAVGLRYVT